LILFHLLLPTLTFCSGIWHRPFLGIGVLEWTTVIWVDPTGELRCGFSCVGRRSWLLLVMQSLSFLYLHLLVVSLGSGLVRLPCRLIGPFVLVGLLFLRQLWSYTVGVTCSQLCLCLLPTGWRLWWRGILW
jgi:hypothetical protein